MRIVVNNQSTYFIEYFMQGNFKYQRIKKIHQILQKILSKVQQSFVFCNHMNCYLQNYTTYQYTYFMY